VDKRTGRAPLIVGINSLMTIFAVLCLAVFALLCVSSVQADSRLGESSRASVTGYYEADCQAERILAQLRQGVLPEEVTGENGLYSYVCPISGTQVLAVEVYVQGDTYEILRWQAESAAAWQADENLPVWRGE